jgi:hypothetical protein
LNQLSWYGSLNQTYMIKREKDEDH